MDPEDSEKYPVCHGPCELVERKRSDLSQWMSGLLTTIVTLRKY